MSAAKKSKAKPDKGSSRESERTSETGRSPAAASKVRSGAPLQAKQPEWKWVVAVLAVTLIAFLNSLDGEFVFDDWWQIDRNPTITSLANIPDMFTQSVWQFLAPKGDTVGPYYRPIFNVSLIINYALFGKTPFGWHLVSVALHLGITLLVYLLCRQWGLTVELAGAAALLFGLHPTKSEPVSWLASQPDLFVSTFLLLSLLFYERYYHGPGGRKPYLLVSLACAALAFFSKEVAIILPGLLIFRELLDWRRGESWKNTAVKLVRRMAPYVALAAFYLLLRYTTLGFISRVEPKAVHIQTLWVYLTVPTVVLGYLRMLFAPYPLAINYGLDYITTIGNPRFWGSVLALAAIIPALVLLVRRSPVGRRALAFAVLPLLPVLNLKAFNQDFSLIQDRYLFLPSIGFSILVVLGLHKLSARFSSGDKLFRSAIVLIALAYLGLTVRQNGFWHNDYVMATNAMRIAPNRPFLLNYMGGMHTQRKEYIDAERYYREALRIDPDYFDSRSNLADALREQGRLAEAVVEFRKAIDAGAPYADTYYNLGVALTSMGKLDEAEAPLIRAIEIHPTKSDARYNLAWTYERRGKVELAMKTYAETLHLNPAYPEPRINLAVMLTKQGKYKEALEQLQTAQRYAPSHPVLLYAMGDAYLRLGKHKEALEPLNQLAQREPRHRLVHTSLGLCHEATGNVRQAKAEFRKAIEVAPQDPYTNTARDHLSKLP
ncbi:MAG: tetratricopeptide repeat protein [Acidobacteria bacterium]|nr:tetratricopeptide repeat protein [Acidobacteriota bacterium]